MIFVVVMQIADEPDVSIGALRAFSKEIDARRFAQRLKNQDEDSDIWHTTYDVYGCELAA
jgi:hypothetical protein